MSRDNGPYRTSQAPRASDATCACAGWARDVAVPAALPHHPRCPDGQALTSTALGCLIAEWHADSETLEDGDLAAAIEWAIDHRVEVALAELRTEHGAAFAEQAESGTERSAAFADMLARYFESNGNSDAAQAATAVAAGIRAMGAVST